MALIYPLAKVTSPVTPAVKNTPFSFPLDSRQSLTSCRYYPLFSLLTDRFPFLYGCSTYKIALRPDKFNYARTRVIVRRWPFLRSLPEFSFYYLCVIFCLRRMILTETAGCFCISLDLRIIDLFHLLDVHL